MQAGKCQRGGFSHQLLGDHQNSFCEEIRWDASSSPMPCGGPYLMVPQLHGSPRFGPEPFGTVSTLRDTLSSSDLTYPSPNSGFSLGSKVICARLVCSHKSLLKLSSCVLQKKGQAPLYEPRTPLPPPSPLCSNHKNHRPGCKPDLFI